MVKFFFSNFSSNRSKPSRYLPENLEDSNSLFENYKNKILTPTNREISENSASRSAKFRYAIRNKNKFIFPDELVVKFKKYLDLESSYA